MDGHKQQSSSIYKHYHDKHGKVLEDLLKRFDMLKKCKKKKKKKFECLMHEMLLISRFFKRSVKTKVSLYNGMFCVCKKVNKRKDRVGTKGAISKVF